MPTDRVVSSSVVFTGLIGPIVPGFFEVDSLSLVFLLGVVALISLLILCAPATRSFVANLVMLVFFLLGAAAVTTAANVVTFLGAWELCSLFAWGIGQLADDERSERGIIPFQAAGALGSLLMILGLILLALQWRGLIFAPVARSSSGPAPLILLLAITLKTYGLLSEGWARRPDDHFSLAGATVAGAGVLAIGLYPFFRFFGPILGEAPGWREPLFWVATVFALLAALAALGDADYRRALAYGVFSQFWLMLMLFSLGTPAAVQAAVVGALADAAAFTGLFLCLSAAEEATAQATLQRVGGLAQRLPLTAALFVVFSISILGLPPLAGFVVDRLIGAAAVGSRVLPIVWMLLLGLTVAYLLRLFVGLFLGEPRGPIRRERRWPMVLASGGVVGSLLLLGANATNLLALLEPLARSRPG